MENKGKIKVLVAMSGGVDSSVAAALLKKQGFEVVGVFLRLADKSGLRRIRADADEKSAIDVAKKLGIKFKVIDARKMFKKTVVDYFLREYKAGRTPNPCAVCNPKIKFATIIKIVDKLGIEYIATGHYACTSVIASVGKPRRKVGATSPLAPRNDSEVKLFEALDKTKNQSYFLYGLSQKQLSRIIFPLGKYKKTEVRAIAKKMGLPVFGRKESHDVCFITGKAEEYLQKNIKLRKGKIVDMKGNFLGEHRGLPLYTIGQRKGIELGGTGPYYVIEKNTAKNQLKVVSKSDNPRLFKKIMLVKSVNWISKPSKFPFATKVRIRYGHSAVYATIKAHNTKSRKIATCLAGRQALSRGKHITRNKKYKVVFEEPQRAITPGQSAVFYSKSGEVLGGGTIVS